MLSRARRTGFVVAVVLVLTSSGHHVVADSPASTSLTADQAAALDRITANSLRGHLSFLASDLLEGRDTPSRGLDRNEASSS